MAGFSGRAAVTSGFRLIAREPLAVFAWSLAYLVVAILPQVAMVASILPDFLALADPNAAVHARAVDPRAGIEAISAKMVPYQLFLMVSGWVASTLMIAAIFRAVLLPDDRAWAYLRTGRRELWLGAVISVMTVLAMFAMIVAFIPFMILVGVSVATSDPGVGGLIVLPLFFGAMAGMGWLFARFCLGLPMAFMDQQFRLFESWSLTRGHGLKMSLVGVSLVAILLVVELVLFGAVMFFALAAVDARDQVSNPASALLGMFLTPSETWLAETGPVLALALLAMSTVSVIVTVLFVAPIAAIYRDLTSGLTASGT